jgi:hypothetical protein
MADVEPLIAGLNYPRKLRMYFANYGDDIHLGLGTWLPEGIGIQSGRKPACVYQLKDHLGKWGGEFSDVVLASGKWVRLYVGLDSSVADEKVQQLKANHSLGILQIPAIVSGVNVVLKVRP